MSGTRDRKSKGAPTTASGAVLRNKGVPLTLHRVTEAEEGWVRIPGEEEVHVRMTNGTLADLEEHYGSMDEWQTALARKPYSAVRESLALILGRSKAELSEAMVEGQIGTYSTVLGAAFMLANGVDADAVGKVLGAGLRDEERRRTILTVEQVDKVVAAIEAEERIMGESSEEPTPDDLATATGTSTGGRTRGRTSSARGRAPDAASSSSGS